MEFVLNIPLYIRNCVARVHHYDKDSVFNAREEGISSISLHKRNRQTDKRYCLSYDVNSSNKRHHLSYHVNSSNKRYHLSYHVNSSNKRYHLSYHVNSSNKRYHLSYDVNSSNKRYHLSYHVNSSNKRYHLSYHVNSSNKDIGEPLLHSVPFLVKNDCGTHLCTYTIHKTQVSRNVVICIHVSEG